MRRFYEGRLAERLLHVSQMAQDRSMMRRGARKMQDGTLGTKDAAEPASDSEDGEDGVSIRIGDDVHYHTTTSTTPAAPAPLPAPVAPVQPPAAKPSNTWGKLAGAAVLGAALLLGGGGLGILSPWALGAFDKPTAVNDTDTDTATSIQGVQIYKP
jgi:hypothetical protein